MTLDGKWKGTIILEKSYKEHQGKVLEIEMDLNQDGEEFWGESLDVKGFAASNINATVKGKLVKDQISFLKKYEYLHYLKGNEIIIDKSFPGYDIHYEGKYNPEKGMFEGEWILKGKQYLFGLIPVPFKNSGKWTLYRGQ